jgi:hypothetical protein
VTRPARPWLPVTGLALVLAAAGCAQGPKPASLAPTTGAPPTAAATASHPAAPAAARVVAPLTGTATSAAAAKRPAVAVTLPIAGSTGLDRADLVYEEYETSTIRRAVALFQSRDAEVGPVGGVRPADPFLLPILRPLYAYNGGGSGPRDLLAQAHVALVTSASAPAAYTSGATGTMVSTAAVQAAAPTAAPPPPVLSYAVATDAFATTALRKSSTVTLTVPGSAPETWTYSATTKRWTLAGVPGVAVSNLLVQVVPYKAVTLRDPVRSARSARVLGRGACYGFSAGMFSPCSWYKPTAMNLTGYVDAARVPLRFAAGPTWITLMPAGASVVSR